jgi:hypothetical protein
MLPEPCAGVFLEGALTWRACLIRPRRAEGKARAVKASYALRLPRLRGFTCLSVDALHQAWLAKYALLQRSNPQASPCIPSSCSSDTAPDSFNDNPFGLHGLHRDCKIQTRPIGWVFRRGLPMFRAATDQTGT